tara:strand:+ start:37301 stop:37570 length:270 start_codon:yes stop_codon:yes gene_type:complete
MHKFEPYNRYVLLERIEAKKEESHVLVPDDYIKEELYGLYKVVSVSGDSKCSASSGSLVAVENSMVQEINISSERFLVVLDNYILGTVR